MVKVEAEVDVRVGEHGHTSEGAGLAEGGLPAVLVRLPHLQARPLALAGGVIGGGFLGSRPQRFGWIEIADAAVLYKYLRHPVVGGG